MIACYMRRDKLSSDATTELIGKSIGKGTAHADVTGRECARLLAFWGCLLHRAIVHILGSDTPCSPVASPHHIGCAGGLGALHIGHEIQIDAAVAHIIDEGRIMEDE